MYGYKFNGFSSVANGNASAIKYFLINYFADSSLSSSNNNCLELKYNVSILYISIYSFFQELIQNNLLNYFLLIMLNFNSKSLKNLNLLNFLI